MRTYRAREDHALQSSLSMHSQQQQHLLYGRDRGCTALIDRFFSTNSYTRHLRVQLGPGQVQGIASHAFEHAEEQAT